MNLRPALLTSALLLAAAAGCYTGSAVDSNRGPDAPTTATDGTDPPLDGEAGARGSKGPAAPTGMPCDVAEVLTTACTTCHGATLTGGAPNRLLTYEDLAAPSEDDANVTMAEVSLARMRSTKRPMPPAGEAKLAPDAVSVFETWIGAGMPRGTCGEEPADAGKAPGTAIDGGVKDAAPDAASVCTSGSFVAAGTPPSALMKPGKACIACHNATGAPHFEIAGTVYPTMHEPNDCNGVAGLKVLIIDATGTTHTMTTNAAGNFMRVSALPRPYRAMIVKGTTIREMKTPQFDGDCNGCHSEWGNKSPGRVMAP